MTSPTTSPAVADAVAAIHRLDRLVEEAAAVRAQRDAAICRAIAEGVRPTVLKRTTGLSLSMIRVIREHDAAHSTPDWSATA